MRTQFPNSALSPEQYSLALELLSFFTIGGENAALVATPGQIELFGRIVFKISLRQHIQCMTQYGKSLFTALACIILTSLDPDHGDIVVVGAPTEDKAKIIMRYFIAHLGDSPHFAQLLSAETKVERLQTETTKDSIILRNGGVMRVFTLNATDSRKGFQAAMGEGADDVIMDESCLIPDDIEATVLRMLAGRSRTGMYVKIGNPFFGRTHFQKSFRDPRYLKLTIDCYQAIREGRITQSFVDESKEKKFFDILYECKFPSDQQIDTKGYYALYKEVQLDIAYMDQALPLIGEKHLGVDISHGGANFSTIVLRADNQAILKFKKQTEDELVLLTEVASIAKAERIPLSDEFIHFDEIGSAALCSRANELWPVAPDGHSNHFGVNVGGKPDPERMPNGDIQMDDRGKPVVKYINLRAQLQERGATWVQRGGKLTPKPEFDELLVLRYKIQSDKKIKAKGKDEMEEEGIPSPDVADGFNLTFVKRPKHNKGVDYEPAPHESMTSFGV